MIRILSILLFVFFFLGCKRAEMDTLIKVKLNGFYYKKPIQNAAILITYTNNEDPSSSFSYRIDTFYTDKNGVAEFFYTASEKKNKHYTIRIIESDSSTQSFDYEFIKPGYPKFYEPRVSRHKYLPIKFSHTSNKTKDVLTVFTRTSNLPFGKSFKFKLNIPLGKDSTFLVPVIYDVFSLSATPLAYTGYFNPIVGSLLIDDRMTSLPSINY